MPEVTVLFNVKNEPVKEKVERELFWHDNLRGELLRFYGGRLGFEYREDEYIVKMNPEERRRRGIRATFRMLPKVEEVEVINHNKTNRTSNESDVRKWFDSYVNYNVTNAHIVGFDRDSITVVISDKEVDDFLYQAERKGFRTRR